MSQRLETPILTSDRLQSAGNKEGNIYKTSAVRRDASTCRRAAIGTYTSHEIWSSAQVKNADVSGVFGLLFVILMDCAVASDTLGYFSDPGHERRDRSLAFHSHTLRSWAVWCFFHHVSRNVVTPLVLALNWRSHCETVSWMADLVIKDGLR